MNIKCKHKTKCKSFGTINCVSCVHNTFEDFYEKIKEEGESSMQEEEEEKENLSKKVAMHPKFKDNQEDNDIEFIKRFFPKIIDEWDDIAIEEIAESARDMADNGLNESEDEWEDLTDEDKENYGRKIAQHPDFFKFIRSHTTRKMFIRKTFPEIYNEVDEFALNDISNMAKFIFDMDFKDKSNKEKGDTNGD